MIEHVLYHDGMRSLQDRFDSRRLADRLAEVTVHRAFTEQDRALIQGASFFFLATADADGWPDCSYKGGVPGFVGIFDDRTLEFPNYDGNGMYRTLGNVRLNPRVGMLFVDFKTARRMRVNGTADLVENDAGAKRYPGANLIVRVRVEIIFPNCPRYLPDAATGEPSVFAPKEGYLPPEPAWKSFDAFKDALPRRNEPRKKPLRAKKPREE